MASSGVVRIGIGVFLLDERGRLLIGKRIGSHGSGTYALPGGHLEFGESFEECALREVKEETNITAHDPALIFITNDIMQNDSKHYVTLFMRCTISEHEREHLQAMEPQKCSSWLWVEWAHLCAGVYSPLFVPLQHFIQAGVHPAERRAI